MNPRNRTLWLLVLLSCLVLPEWNQAQSRPEAGLDKPDRRLDLALGLGPRFHPKMLDFATASFRASVIPIEQRLGILALGELHPCWSSPRHSGELNRDCRRWPYIRFSCAVVESGTLQRTAVDRGCLPRQSNVEIDLFIRGVDRGVVRVQLCATVELFLGLIFQPLIAIVDA